MRRAQARSPRRQSPLDAPGGPGPRPPWWIQPPWIRLFVDSNVFSGDDAKQAKQQAAQT